MTDKVNLPKELTAENGAKALLMGEFKETVDHDCQECYGDGCSDCNGEGYVTQSITISWSNIKDIYAMVVKHYAD